MWSWLWFSLSFWPLVVRTALTQKKALDKHSLNTLWAARFVHTIVLIKCPHKHTHTQVKEHIPFPLLHPHTRANAHVISHSLAVWAHPHWNSDMQTSDILIISVPTPVNDQLVCNYINYHTCHGCQLASQIKKERLVRVGKRKGWKQGEGRSLQIKR